MPPISTELLILVQTQSKISPKMWLYDVEDLSEVFLSVISTTATVDSQITGKRSDDSRKSTQFQSLVAQHLDVSRSKKIQART